MDDFVETYHIITNRIKQYRQIYQTNEMAVRDQLINPMLRVLGWNPEDPEQVVPHLRLDEGIPDYALMVESTPMLFLEAKNLNEDVGNYKWINQLMKYAFEQGTQYGVLTNGVVWLLAISFKQGTRSTDRIIWTADLENETPNSLLRKLSMLHRTHISELDSLVQKAQLVEEVWTSILADPKQFGLAISPVVQDMLRDAYPEFDFSLEELQDYLTEKVEELLQNSIDEPTPEQDDLLVKESDLRTISISGKTYSIKHVYDILLLTAEWLIKQGKLRKTDVPIKLGSKRYLIAERPVHPYNNNSFRNPKKLSNGLYIESAHSRVATINQAKSLLQHFGYPPEILTIHLE
ncbi:MAG: type I restriction endonuclease [Sulfobacillus thermotolerans]|nr:type I restriction endonuclease [Sulfobacillus thermotolerans]